MRLVGDPSCSYSLPAVPCGLSGLRRLGAANMALCVFFSMKNTPLLFLTATSHAELNVLHQVVGYAASILILFHAVLYTIHFGRQNRWETLLEAGNIEGIGAGIAMIILSMAIFRHWNYRLFYSGHILGFMIALILTGLHRPDWAKKLPVVVLCTACIWATDRSIRTVRTAYHLFNNQVTLCPLPDGGTRLLVRKPSDGAILPGAHCFLWIPRLRLFHVHPFTVVNSGPSGLEFVIKSHQGITKEIRDLASNLLGVDTIRVSLDGPYGSLPDTSAYDRIILIAGGSGAAFTFGLMNRMMRHSGKITLQTIHFVWTVKRSGMSGLNAMLNCGINHGDVLENFLWFHDHLVDLMETNQGINMELYVTSEPRDTRRYCIAKIRGCTGGGRCNSNDIESNVNVAIHETPQDDNIDVFLCGSKYWKKARWQKMDVEAVIWAAAQAAEGHERILVATCGPRPLTNAVRDAVKKLKDQRGLRTDIHSEDFCT